MWLHTSLLSLSRTFECNVIPSWMSYTVIMIGRSTCFQYYFFAFTLASRYKFVQVNLMWPNTEYTKKKQNREEKTQKIPYENKQSSNIRADKTWILVCAIPQCVCMFFVALIDNVVAKILLTLTIWLYVIIGWMGSKFRADQIAWISITMNECHIIIYSVRIFFFFLRRQC